MPIFLAPLEELRQTALVGSMYTPEFRIELARRLELLYSEDDLARMIAEAGAADLADYVERAYDGGPQEPLPQAREIPPLD
ncbi:hypothetical protein BH20GEM1_BH20GEM1_04700 [soil metagenome]